MSTLEALNDQAHRLDVSPLVLSDRLLTLAQDADRAGLRATADKLVRLAHTVFDTPFHH